MERRSLEQNTVEESLQEHKLFGLTEPDDPIVTIAQIGVVDVVAIGLRSTATRQEVEAKPRRLHT